MIIPWEQLFQLLLSFILGGLIGFQRESINRPAGFRTHILVSLGSTLVMQTSFYVFDAYHTMTTIDPMRLGAQVISGMGFLGAGTIIKEGASVKGLTTAASLWAVACIGLAIGTGFYAGAIITTLLIYFILTFFMDLEKKIKSSKGLTQLRLLSFQRNGQLTLIGDQLALLDVEIVDVIINETPERNTELYLTLSHKKQVTKAKIIMVLSELDGIKEIQG